MHRKPKEKKENHRKEETGRRGHEKNKEEIKQNKRQRYKIFLTFIVDRLRCFVRHVHISHKHVTTYDTKK